ncbi:tRNA (uridine(34)/cytosine(34)/5-carboxymethylaminomethyluridine(34)-2'-O)-methyltransferase TrmL [Serinibacter arcticus]|uniref:Putative tRNA (cytidine(34)-2'-O)-methyltransferase n=1 Tax=Serinibacter arcticus TaxID=1655435 RepID=A0A2U1ZRF5_9MICO|nr:tRNA (cytidine(34)-2'-O)-methyltransferase [Serinibacter arcticus]PWD49574.1 tRNA (uridine(34)/cytosine(34)/5-carboxymethylaminomethyluridine(34)-2'-O)-methyltransferase TrmL [Serinibacter arcticus]
MSQPHATPTPPTSPLAHLVFFEPCIPGNSGAAIRLAALTGAQLHLVEPLGFDMSEAKLRRAGLDYHDLAHVAVQPDLDAALAAAGTDRVFAFTAATDVTLPEVEFAAGDVLLFGPEPTGLPQHVLDDPRITSRVRIPMRPGLRSLNLANAATVALYELWRQLDYTGGV